MKKRVSIEISATDKRTATAIQRSLFEDFQYGLQPKNLTNAFQGAYQVTDVKNARGERVGVAFDYGRSWEEE